MINKIRCVLIIVITIIFYNSIDAQKIKNFIASDSLINAGIDLHENRDYEKAIELYKQVYSSDPNYPLALYEIGLSFYEQKEYDSSVYYTTICVQNKESSIYERAVILRGLALADLENFADAHKNFDDVLTIYPKNVWLLHNKGLVYKKQKEYQKALDIFKEVNVEYSGYINNQLAIAQLAEEEGYLTQAILSYCHALLYSLGTNRHIAILSDLNKLVSKKIIENPKDLVFSSDGDQFSEIETLLKSQVALQKKYKISTEFDLPLVRQLHLLFSQLENYELGNGYYDQYYIPIYKELAKNGHFDKFIDLLLVPVNDQNIQKILSRRVSEIKNFAEDLGVQLATTVNKRDIIINGKKLNLACHFANGIKSCGDYNENKRKDGIWYYYHLNGNIQRFGKVVDGQTDGRWEYFYQDGKKSAEYMFKDDKTNGIYKKYYINGKIKEEGSYVEDSLDGDFKTYYLNGNIKSKGTYSNNHENGEWRTFYVNGNPRSIINYNEGEYDGDYSTFAIDGKTPLVKLNYKSGKLDGKQESFYINGNKKEDMEFSQDKKVGEQKEYYTTGVLKEESTYENGEYIEQKEYYASGKINAKYRYKKGELEFMELYDYDENHTTSYIFKNDYVKQVITYDINGEELAKESIGKNDEFVNKWFYTGNKAAQGNYKKGKRHGRWYYYNLNGTKDIENNFELGVKTGVQRDFNYLGKLSSEYEMKNGELNGYYRNYYESGKLKSEGWYIDGKKHGPWYEYYINGTLKNELYYVDDNVEGQFIEYDPDGKIITISNYKEDVFLSYTNYDREGNEMSKVEISDNKTEMKPCTKLSFAGYHREKIFGLLEGLVYSEPLPGVFDYRGSFLAGEVHGLYTYYFPNGNKYSSANYMLDEKNGIDTLFYPNGAIYSVEQQVLGINNGFYKRYYYNGNIWLERNFIHDNRDSVENIYAINGELVLQKIYKLGYFYGIVRNNSNGELLDTLQANNETLEYEANYKNGKLAFKEKIILDNLVLSENYNENGELLYIYEGDDSGDDIKKEFYYINGKPLSISKYEQGQLTEKSFYREDGSINMREEYKLGELHGRTFVKDEQGNNKVNIIYRKNVAYELGE